MKNGGEKMDFTQEEREQFFTDIREGIRRGIPVEIRDAIAESRRAAPHQYLVKVNRLNSLGQRLRHGLRQAEGKRSIGLTELWVNPRLTLGRGLTLASM